MKIYITFGQIHVHSVNGKTFDKDCVAVIEAESEIAGRAKAFEYFKKEWHQSCTEDGMNKEMMSYFPRGLMPVN